MHGEQTRGDKEQRDSRCQSQNKESRFSGPSAFLPLSFKDLPVFRVSAGLRLRDTARSLSKLLRLLSLRCLSKLLRLLSLRRLAKLLRLLSLRCLAKLPGLLSLRRLAKLLRLLCLWILTC